MFAATGYRMDAPTVFTVGPVEVTTTVVVTWGVLVGLAVLALVVRDRLDPKRPGALQIGCEALVTWLDNEIRNIIGRRPDRYFPFIATIFVFILVGNLVASLPFVKAPTADLSTTVALAVIVAVSVPVYGIAAKGVIGYLRVYVSPTPFMLPLNIIGEATRTVALAIRLFANIMSGGLIVAVLVGFVPIILPTAMELLGLITALVQAYVFPVLAMVYIGGAVRLEEKREQQRVQREHAEKEA